MKRFKLSSRNAVSFVIFKTFAALQVLFNIFLLIWAVKWRISCILFEIICFVIFRNGHFHIWTLKTTLFRRCLTLFISTLKYTTLIWRCKFQRWNIQRCFNVDLTLAHVRRCIKQKATLKQRWNVCWDVIRLSLTVMWKVEKFQLFTCFWLLWNHNSKKS